MNAKTLLISAGIGVLASFGARADAVVTRTWTGAGADNLASTAANWKDAAAPAEGEAVLLDGATDAAQKAMTWDLPVKLAAWTQEGYTNVVTFQTTYDTYSTTLTNVIITGNVKLASGTWTHLSNKSITSANDKIVQYYRLMVTVGGDFEIATNATSGAFGKIDVSGKGRSLGLGGAAGDRGGCYGGSTGDYPNNGWGTTFKRPYDTGAGAYNRSIPGGGAVWIDCAGDVKVDGLVKADGITGWNGTTPYRSSSGGAIYVKGKTVKGAGRISASGFCDRQHDHGCGGGGRVALYATDANAKQSDFIANAVAEPSWGGNGSEYHAAAGTVYTETASDAHKGVLMIDNGTHNTTYNGSRRARTSLLAGMQPELDEGLSKIILRNYARLGIEAGATLDIANTVFEVDQTTSCRVHLYGTLKTAATFEFENITIHALGDSPALQASTLLTIGTDAVLETTTASLSMPGSLTVAAGGRICHYGADGNSIDLAVAGDLTVAADGVIDASDCGRNASTEKGYPTSSTYSGSSYGGRGHPRNNYGESYYYVTPCWGSIYAPVGHGANGSKGYGAGAIKLAVTGDTTLDGRIASVGSKGDWAGGSGGSIILSTKRLTGSGSIQANGGWAWNRNDAGGGGRIAITLTEAGRTLEDFSGALANFGRWQKGSGESIYETTPGNNAVMGGAGSTYVRLAGEDEDEGTLIFDQKTTLAKTDADYATSEITADMPDKAYGKVLVVNGARLSVTNNAEISCSVWSNTAAAAFASTAKLTLVGDKDGNAYVWGETTFSNLEIDPSVSTVYFEAGKTTSVSASFKAVGADAENRIRFRSTQDGTKFSLNVDTGAIQTLDYLDVKDSDATGAGLLAQHSVGSNTGGWTFQNIEPGTKFYWTGAADSVWGNAANWALEDASAAQRAPVATDLVFIDASAHDPVLPQSEMTLSNLTVRAGATLTLNGYDLAVTGDAAIYGALVASSSETITFGGAVDFTDGVSKGSFTPASGTVVFANDDAASLDLAGLSFSTVRFANSAVATLAGSFTTTYLYFAAGASLAVDPAASVTTVALYVTGEDGNRVTLASTTSGTAYTFTVQGYAEVAYTDVTDADSSAGEKIYATNSTGARTANWVFEDNRKVWKGTSSTAYATAANWKDGVVPSDGDDVVIAADASRAMAITTEGVSLGSLTVLSQGFSTTKPVTLAGSLVLLGGTSTVNRKVTVGGSLVMFSGATLNHSEQGANKSTLQNWCELDVAGNALIAEGATITADTRGYRPNCGPGAKTGCGGSYGGTSGIRNAGDTTSTCYGSVFAPADCGSGGIQGNAAGGLVKLTVAGTLTLDGTITAGAGNSGSDCKGASGGGVNIRAGELVGTGSIHANGENSTGNCYGQGGGGRIALVLTKAGSDFSRFTGTVEALGGYGKGGDAYGGCAGTIYRQTGGQAYGTGTIRVTLGTAKTQTDSNQNRKWAGCGLGFEGSDDLSQATLELGASAGIFLHGDATIGNLVFLSEAGGNYPTMVNFNGYQLNVNARRPKKTEWTSLTKYKFNNVHNGTVTFDPGSNLHWKIPPTFLMVR